MTTIKITLFYRDASNYKFSPEFKITLSEEKVEELKKRINEDNPEPDTEYDRELGITMEEFHKAIGHPYFSRVDHNFVSIESIEILES